MKQAYIYTYVNKETKKTYIGARCNYKGSCYDDFNIKYFSSSNDKEFRKDMADGKLECQIVLVMNDDNADKKIFEVEAKIIQAYWKKYGKKNSYNHYAAGKFNTAGMHKHNSDETKEKIRSSIIGRHLSEKTKEKIRSSMKGKRIGEKHPNYGKHLSDTTRNKISDSLKGKPSWMKGKKLSDETREKISDSLKGKPSGMKGKKLSDETRKKLSIALSGEKNPLYGKHLSDETRAKISAACKGIKCKKKIKYKWMTLDGEIKMMNAGCVKRWHPDWKLIEE